MSVPLWCRCTLGVHEGYICGQEASDIEATANGPVAMCGQCSQLGHMGVRSDGLLGCLRACMADLEGLNIETGENDQAVNAHLARARVALRLHDARHPLTGARDSL